MQTETGRIIYYLTDFKSRQDQLKDRPYMIFEDMAVVFGILDADRYTVHPIDVTGIISWMDYRSVMGNGKKEYAKITSRKN